MRTIAVVVAALAVAGGVARGGTTAAGERAPAASEPSFRGTITRISPALRARMTSWRPGCPVPPRRLRLLTLTHWGFDGEVRTGRLIVNRYQAPRVLGVMRKLYDARFPIRRMRLIEAYGSSDHRSMAANNTSAFNCRYVAGTRRWSEHAYGRAIDVNPIQNPYVRGSYVSPPAGRPFVDRSRQAPGMIHAGDAVVDAFASIGWGWGGYWRFSKDYQHFSATGR